MQNVLIVLLTTFCFNLYAQNNNPIVQKKGTNVKAFLPNGWKIIYEVKGDLNKDNLTDYVMIIENTDRKNIIKNDGMGAKELNVNPRMLLVLIKDKNGYTLAARNQKFIPTQNDTTSTCLADPLAETGAISIVKGTLILSYQYWLSCGSYGVTNNKYIFRFQDNKFKLIGFEGDSFSRSSGEENNISINFFTKKKSETSGGNMFDEKVNKPKTRWKNISWKALLALDEMTEEATQKFWEI